MFLKAQKLVGERRDLLCNHGNAEFFMREEDSKSSRESLPRKVFRWCFYNRGIEWSLRAECLFLRAKHLTNGGKNFASTSKRAPI